MLLSTVCSLAVIGGTWFLFKNKNPIPVPSFFRLSLESAFFVPKGVSLVQAFFNTVSFETFKKIEVSFFNQSPDFLIARILILKKVFSKLQNGNIQSYALFFTVGLTVSMLLIFLT